MYRHIRCLPGTTAANDTEAESCLNGGHEPRTNITVIMLMPGTKRTWPALTRIGMTLDHVNETLIEFLGNFSTASLGTLSADGKCFFRRNYENWIIKKIKRQRLSLYFLSLSELFSMLLPSYGDYSAIFNSIVYQFSTIGETESKKVFASFMKLLR